MTSGSSSRRVKAAPEDVAEAAREAGTSFLVAVRNGMGKAQLAAWLLGPYAHATSFTHEEERVVDDGWLHPQVVAESLDDVLFGARAEILEALDSAIYGGRSKPAFVENAIAHGGVTPFIWMPGVRGWAPRDRARLRVRDRVLALFAADYLTRPESYARELYVCPDCMCAAFDEDAVSRGKCPLHDRPSGVRHPPRSLDERVDELLAQSADLDEVPASGESVMSESGAPGRVMPGSYRFVAGEPYTSPDFGSDPKPSEPIILLKRRIKTA
jgi:hypothetical protein